MKFLVLESDEVKKDFKRRVRRVRGGNKVANKFGMRRRSVSQVGEIKIRRLFPVSGFRSKRDIHRRDGWKKYSKVTPTSV